MDQPFHLGDLHRLLFGQSSAVFLLEAVLRAALTYIGVVWVMRILGPRVAGQFTVLEISIAVVVAAAIGVPLLSADRGLLPALVLVATLVLAQRVVAGIGFRHRRVQTAVSADLCTVVRDGALDLAAMRNNVLSRQAIFSQLRVAGHLNLGEVSRVYVEPSGHFSVLAAKNARPGLSLVPARDTALLDRMQRYGCVCARCGWPRKSNKPACERCHASRQAPAVLAPDELA